MNLQNFVRQSLRHSPDSIAIKGSDTCLTYGKLDRLPNTLAHIPATHETDFRDQNFDRLVRQ